MTGEDPDVRRKHHRSPDDGVEEGSKLRKHSHRRSSHRNHRHRSIKHKHETKHEEEGEDLVSHPTLVIVVSSSNSRPEEDKEEDEIFEEKDYRVAVAVADVDLKKKKKKKKKKKRDSDAESGEIMSEDVAGKSDNRNPGTNGDGSTIADKTLEDTDLNLDLLPLDDETTQDSRNKMEYQPPECSDKPDIADDSRNDQLVGGGTKNEMGKIDESDAGYKASMSRKKKGDKRHGDSSSRDSRPNRANGDVGEMSYLVDMKTNRGSKSAKKGYEKDRSSCDIDESVLCKRGRSRSPVDKGDVDSRKHWKIDDSTIKTDGLIARRHLELMDNGRNGLGNRRTSMSLESRWNKYKSVSRPPSYNRYNDEPQIRKRSMSRDHVRERSVSRSTLQEGRVHHHERDVKSYSDTNDRGKTSDSREKGKDEYDNERVGRHGSKDHRSERERSSSYSRHSGREDIHRSRDTQNRDREKEIGREREWEWERVRGRNRDKSSGRDRERDRDSYRGRDRNREREREMERSRDGYKDFRHSKHDESDYHFEKIRSQGSAKVSSNRNEDSEVSGENLKRDVDDQDGYEERVELKLAHQEEEDINRIKEESRKRRQAILEKYKQQQSQQQSERSAYIFCDDIFGESPAGVREMVKTDVVVGTAQPTSSSPFQFGSFVSVPPNPPNPKQTQPHPRPTVQSHSKPNTKSLPPNPKQKPPNPPRSFLTLLVSWGRGLRSSHRESIEAVHPVFTIHTLAGNNINSPPGLQLEPFNSRFEGFSKRASDCIYHCRNIMHNYLPLTFHDREHIHNTSFWKREWEKHRHECGMTQIQYYDFIFREFRRLNAMVYPAFMEACEDTINGRSIFDVDKFLLELSSDELFPSIHVAWTHFSVDGEAAADHQELVELKFYLSCSQPTISYAFPMMSNYDSTQPLFVTM